MTVERAELTDARVRAIVDDELRRRLPPLPDEMIGPLLDVQASAKLASLAAAYPHLRIDLLSADGVDVGYVATAATEGGGTLRLCDIAVIGAARGSGHGRLLLRRVLDRAAADGQAVTLSVWHDAPARSWYERVGFIVVGGDAESYLEMRREVVAGVAE